MENTIYSTYPHCQRKPLELAEEGRSRLEVRGRNAIMEAIRTIGPLKFSRLQRVSSRGKHLELHNLEKILILYEWTTLESYLRTDISLLAVSDSI